MVQLKGDEYLKEIRPGIYFVEGENRGRYPFGHSLFVEGAVNTLIDTGAGAFLASLSGKTEQVFLSHYHRDHVSYNHLFAEADFSIHIEDAPAVETLDGYIELSGIGREEIIAYWKSVRKSGFNETRINRYLSDGDLIHAGSLVGKVIHLPGHTPGHCGLWFDNYGLIFAADIDLTDFGPWYGNKTSDIDQFRNSIRRLRSLNPEVVVTGHCEPLTSAIRPRMDAYERVLDQRDEAIIAELKQAPAGSRQLAEKNIIYRQHHDRHTLLYFEEVMIIKHLNSLLRKSIIAKTEDDLYYLL
jgi:glyoxylase-like metal-dependent hydrolase (beta-lactamase superfamily II)